MSPCLEKVHSQGRVQGDTSDCKDGSHMTVSFHIFHHRGSILKQRTLWYMELHESLSHSGILQKSTTQLVEFSDSATVPIHLKPYSFTLLLL